MFKPTIESSEPNDYSSNSSVVDNFSNWSHSKEYAKGIGDKLKHKRQLRCDANSMEYKIKGRPLPTRPSHESNYVINFPAMLEGLQPEPCNSFHALQEWEGCVLEANEDEFTARLLDITAGAIHEDEEVTFPLAEVAETDHKYIRPGSIFRWVIGYENLVSGSKQRVSRIVFRDLPVMSVRDISEGKEWARKIVQSFKD